MLYSVCFSPGISMKNTRLAVRYLQTGGAFPTSGLASSSPEALGNQSERFIGLFISLFFSDSTSSED